MSNADDGMGAEALRLVDHLLERGVASVAQHALIGARAPADHVADGGEEIAEHVGAENRLARDDARDRRRCGGLRWWAWW